jgi:hypothetical protein
MTDIEQTPAEEAAIDAPETTPEAPSLDMDSFIAEFITGRRPDPAVKEDEPSSSETTTTPAPEPEEEEVEEEEEEDPRAGIDYDRIGEAVAKAVNKKAPETTAPPADDVPPSVARKLPYLKRLEETDPVKYKGLADKYVSAHKARADYESRWSAANPGEAFDPESSEHDVFFSRNAVSWDEDDYLEAVADVRADARTASLQEQLEQHRRDAELAPKIKAAKKEARKEIVSELQDDIKQPVLGDIISKQADYAEQVTESVHRLFNGGRYDESNPIHRQVSEIASMAEGEVLRLPKSKHIDAQGRVFATTDEFVKLSPEQRAQRWILSERAVQVYATNLIKHHTKNLVSQKKGEIQQYLEAAGYVRPAAGNKDTPKVAPAKAPVSPESPQAPKMAGGGGRVEKSGDAAEDNFWKTF